MNPALLLSDVHLAPGARQSASLDLARLMGRHPGAGIYLVGDIFDLSCTPPGGRPGRTLTEILDAHPDFVRAARQHLSEGGRLSFVLGNHDADLVEPAVAAVLRAALRPNSESQLQILPWFCRHGDVHIEHGHVYDPDCAPSHPLAPHDPKHEGLGTALVRRFLLPSAALELAHAHETSPRQALAVALRKWGFRAPLNIGRYFWTSASLCAESLGNQGAIARDRKLGDAKLAAFAERVGLDVGVLQALLERAPTPTHHEFSSMFLRLYFDRVLATTALGLGGASALLSAVAPGLLLPGGALATLGLGYLALSGAHSSGRTQGPMARLEQAASSIRELTGASLVVLGHSHVAVQRPGYVNLGSFSFGGGARPYLLLDQAGRAETKRLAA